MSGAEKPSGAQRREARAQHEHKERRKVRTATIVIVVVMVLLFAVALLINSKLIRRVMPAVTVGGVKFSAAEYDYFYHSAALEYSNAINSQFKDNASEYLPKNDKPHTSQIYNAETGETWADVFNNLAIERLKEIVSYHNDAERNGYAMTDETRAKVDEEIANLRQTADMYGSSVDELLQRVYGSSINEKTFKKIMEFMETSTAYVQYVHDAFSYDADALEQQYKEKKDSYDIFTYRYFMVNMESIDEEEYDSAAEYEEAKETVLADTLAKAEEIAAQIDSEDAFIAAARDYNESMYTLDDSTLHTYRGDSIAGMVYEPWLKEAARAYGDVKAFEMSNGAYIVLYVSRDDNNYKMPEMRQILISPITVNEDDYAIEPIDPEDYNAEGYDDNGGYDTEGYLKAVEDAQKETKEKAETALQLFKDGGASEDKLKELMEEYSDDPSEGGLHKEITKYAYQNKMDPEIEQWLFDPARKYGDYELIETKDSGYHLVFFIGLGERYCDLLADKDLREADYNDWKTNLEAPEVVEHWAMLLTEHRGKSREPFAVSAPPDESPANADDTDNS